MHEPATQAAVPVVAIGASAGGVTALQDLFDRLPDDLGAAYVVILHLAPDRPSQMAEVLGSRTTMPVQQVLTSSRLGANCVYVIPPDRELIIETNNLTARPISEPRGRRAPVDMFFRSVAKGRGDGMAVVLSGSGSDGAVGVRAIKEGGGVILVQDPNEAEHPQMPQSAIGTGGVDFVATVQDLAGHLTDLLRRKERIREVLQEQTDTELRQVIALLRRRVGHDFSEYKRVTLQRQVARRMQVTRCDTIDAYTDLLQRDEDEAHARWGVSDPGGTGHCASVRPAERRPKPAHLGGRLRNGGRGLFHRDSAVGRSATAPNLSRHSDLRQRLRCRCLGPGAGGPLFPRHRSRCLRRQAEALFRRRRHPLSGAQRIARNDPVRPTQRAQRPPFIRLDLIACRNLMIYLQRELQQQLAQLFHYALNSDGFLFLGSAESLESYNHLFRVIDRDARLYAMRGQIDQLPPALPQLRPGRRLDPLPDAPERRSDRAATAGQAHAASLEKAAPPSVLVGEDHRVLHLSPTVSRFFLPSEGPPSLELPSMVRPELRVDLKLALRRAFEQNRATLTLPVAVAFNGASRLVALHILPNPDARTENRPITAPMTAPTKRWCFSSTPGQPSRPMHPRPIHRQAPKRFSACARN